jgi:hypothetical protein
VEEGPDLEGEEAGRLHGAGLGCDWEEKKEGKKKKGARRPCIVE